MAHASLEETLAFCNKVREAGGADPLEALMPSIPQNENSCLIARNLNFDCEVSGGAYPDAENRWGKEALWEDGTDKWFMFVDDVETRYRIANYLGLKIETLQDGWDEIREGITLPKEIGNVAAEFDAWLDDPDNHQEFTPFVENVDQYEFNY